MADWSDIAFQATQVDYIFRLETLRTRSQAVATEVENARNGEASLAARLAVINGVVANNFSASVKTAGLGANLPANGYRLTGAGNAVNPQDYVTLADAQALLVAGGSVGAVPITGLGLGTALKGQYFMVGAAGNVAAIDGPTAVAFTYDTSLRPLTVTETLPGGSRVSTYAYLANGAVNTITVVFGGRTVTHTHNYNTDGTLASVTLS